MVTTRLRSLAALLAVGVLASASFAADAPLPKPADVKSLAINPPKVTLKGSDDAAQLIVTATLNDGFGKFWFTTLAPGAFAALPPVDELCGWSMVGTGAESWNEGCGFCA